MDRVKAVSHRSTADPPPWLRDRTMATSAPAVNARELANGGLTSAAGRLYCSYRQQRKEVVQCLIPSAVTSLRSPAKFRAPHETRMGALAPGSASRGKGAAV